MWFGTEEYMQWVPAPMSGADMGAKGWATSGTLLNGGGFGAGSFGSHKNYSFSWSAASSPEAALLMQAYQAGTYGRGHIQLVDPTAYGTNILPAHWADPSLALGNEAPTLLRTRNLPVTPSVTSNFRANRLPVRGATYDLTAAAVGFPGARDSLFIPVPPGYQLRLGAFYSATATAGLFAAPVDAAGSAGTPIKLTPLAADASVIIPDAVPAGALGVRLWLGKTAPGPASATLRALIARLVHGALPDGKELYGPWVAGEGHSGLIFNGPPTYVKYNGVDGGQVGYAASFKETGSWAY
jgi:hypothetical protein